MHSLLAPRELYTRPLRNVGGQAEHTERLLTLCDTKQQCSNKRSCHILTQL